jgi:hypothetical protein
MLNELIDMHILEINISYEKNENKLTAKQIERLEKIFDILNDNNIKYTDNSNYKAYKINI